MNIVVVGGGIGGVSVARYLSNWLGSGAAVTLVADDDHHRPVFAPDICLPLRPLLERLGVTYQQARVTDLAVADRAVVTDRDVRIPFDHLVLAFGLKAGLPTHWQERVGVRHLYTPAARMDVRYTLRRLLAHLQSSSRHKATVRIIGGGETGVEFAQALANLRTRLEPTAHRRWQIEVYERQARLLPHASARRSAITNRRLLTLGVKTETFCEVGETELRRWTFIDQPEYMTLTIWAGGQVAPNLFDQSLFVRDRRGRIVTDRHLRAQGQACVWVVGDAASLADSGTAAAAYAQGRVCAANIARSLRGETLIDYEPTNRSLTALTYLARLLPISELWRLATGTSARCSACRL